MGYGQDDTTGRRGGAGNGGGWSERERAGIIQSEKWRSDGKSKKFQPLRQSFTLSLCICLKTLGVLS